MKRRVNIDAKLDKLLTFGDKQPGDVGIEIEAEGVAIPTAVKKYWDVKEDHSLRAPAGGACWEYVTKGAIKTLEVPEALRTLSEAFEGSRPRWSYRTSVHIHINVRDMSLRHIYNFMTLYMILEELLSEYAGGLARSGNLFCQRMIDSEEIVDNLRDCIVKDNIEYLMDDGVHYAGMNYNALFKFGSVEFRAMHGNLDVPYIQSWVDQLLSLRAVSSRFKNPGEIINELSHLGPEGFLQRYLSWKVFRVVSTYDDVVSKIYRGVRLVQPMALGVSWPDVVENEEVESVKISTPKRRRIVQPLVPELRARDGGWFIAAPPEWNE